MRLIQSKILPINWLEAIQNFDISNSTLSENNKIFATYLIPIILEEKEKSLANSLCRILIQYIIFKIDFLKFYDNLPPKLIEDTFDEIKNERGIYLVRKLHSIFIEFLTYQDLFNKGYIISDFTREQGSCYLIMSKDGQTYNFEVKFKESPDVGKLRLYDYIDGYSLLEKNKFLSGKNIKINLKVDSLNDSNLPIILKEINIFIDKQEDVYDGENIQIFDSNKKSKQSRDINQVLKISNSSNIERIDDIDKLVCDIFIRNNGHLTKLIKKSGRYKSKDNFTGCLIWSIPFHINIDNDKIKNAFKKINLNFDLFVYIVDIGKDEFNFFIPNKS